MMNKKLSYACLTTAVLIIITLLFVMMQNEDGENPNSSSASKRINGRPVLHKRSNTITDSEEQQLDQTFLMQKIAEICSEYNKPFYFDAGTRETRLEIPATMHLITGLSKDKSYNTRMNALRRMRGQLSGCNLSEKELEALLSFLHKDPKTEKLSIMELDAIKNDVVCLLIDQKRRDIKLSHHLIAMYFDKKMDTIWREYCVQFMGNWYNKTASDDERELLHYTLNESLKGGEHIAGTAILQMSRLVGDEKTGFKKKEVRDKAYKLLSDPNTGDQVKMTAFQVAANLDHPEVTKLAREVIQEKGGNVLLKMSAIAVLGKRGNVSDIQMLNQLTKSTDTRLRKPARAAIKKLEGGGVR